MFEVNEIAEMTLQGQKSKSLEKKKKKKKKNNNNNNPHQILIYRKGLQVFIWGEWMDECLEWVYKVSRGCLEGVWKVSGGYVEGIWNPT